ncbi:unnamed protein product [Amoebophrya sp. A120]|nr:unnamed protein product [Amoebophrya sp. A120]|eukprot:GSA120T00017408001.1
MGEYVNIGEAGQPRKQKTFLEEFMPSSFGKTEHSILREVELRYGFTWDRMHAYKTIMEFPTLPDHMPPSHILDDKNVPRCKLPYDVLDRCMVVETARETRKEPFARMYVCKEFFTAFDRCTRRRDMRMLERILKWEGNHFQSLGADDKKQYTGELQTKHEYLQYAIEHDPTPALKEKAQRDACHMEFRLDNLETLDDPKKHRKLKWRLSHYLQRGGGRGSSWNRRMWDAHRVEWNKESPTFSDPIWKPKSAEERQEEKIQKHLAASEKERPRPGEPEKVSPPHVLQGSKSSGSPVGAQTNLPGMDAAIAGA